MNNNTCPKCGSEHYSVHLGGVECEYKCGTGVNGLGGLKREGNECLRRQLSKVNVALAKLQGEKWQEETIVAERDTAIAQLASMQAERDEQQQIIDHLHETAAKGISYIVFLEERVAETKAQNPGQTILDELASLRAIVDKLPLTADGVKIGPGTSTWKADLSGEIIEWEWGVLPWYDTDNLQTLLRDSYSTREAALAAKEGAK